jgi:serine/threonine protein kinase
MIPSRPPPTFKDMSRWTPALNDFVSKCLVKNPDARSTATELLNVIFKFYYFLLLIVLYFLSA